VNVHFLMYIIISTYYCLKSAVNDFNVVCVIMYNSCDVSGVIPGVKVK
jgi:hypothetical protein